jgi:hypothetical protein
MRHAAGVPGFARSFQPVHQNHFAFGLPFGSLNLQQNLNIWLGLYDYPLDWPPLFGFRARPKISRDRSQVGIAKERFERAQIKL